MLSSTLTAGSITVPGGTTTISVTANGGTMPYLYGLNGGLLQTNSYFNNITAGDYTITTKDNNGCVSLKNIVLAESTESYYNPRFKVSIWPNPTTNFWQLQLSKIHGPYTVYLTVYSAAGQLIYSTKGNVYTTYSFGQTFAPGTYYVKIKIGTGTKTYSLLKL